MDTPSYSSPVRTYVDNHYSMRVSNDGDNSDPKDFGSGGLGSVNFAGCVWSSGLLMYLSH